MLSNSCSTGCARTGCGGLSTPMFGGARQRPLKA
jgi:hypothetical protein